MHVLIAHNDYARPSGEEDAVELFADILQAKGHRVSWFRRSSVEIEGRFAHKVTAALAGIRNPFSRRDMAQVLDRTRPDVVLVQNLYPFLSSSILRPCSERRIPIVMRCPNYRLFCPSGLHMTDGQICERCLGRGRELWCVLKNCELSLVKSGGYAARNAATRLSGSIYRHVSVFVVLSEFQKKRFVGQGLAEERLAVVPNTAPRHFFDLPVEIGTHVSFMGRVAIEKGIEGFIALARMLPGIPFAVAGAVKETARALLCDLPPNVTFHGHLAGSGLTEFVRRTRILLSCSLCFEGFPNAVVQAMAAGRPVVAGALGPIPEIVADGQTGLLYRPGDLRGAAAMVKALHENPAACAAMGAAGRRRALDTYQPDTAYHALMRAFENAVSLRN